MTILEAVILGIVQGLTEFLPVSSSGHLTIGKALLGITEKGILFDVIVHLGTLFAVATAFWPDIVWMSRGLGALVRRRKEDPARETDEHRQARRYSLFLVYATVPTVIVGLFFHDFVERAYGSPLLAAAFLLVTGAILLLSRLGLNATGNVTMGRALAMGLAQVVAILPGISRSGSTIATGMLAGMEREQAARFSFLMALPAISGAFVLQMVGLIKQEVVRVPVMPMIAGFAVSYLSGYLAIRALMKLVRHGRFDYFAWYCFAVGLTGIYFFALR